MASQPRFLEIPASRLELSEQEVVPRGSIDEIDFVDGLPGLVRHRAPQVAATGAPFLVRGWALDAGRQRLGEELLFKIGPNTISAGFDHERPDIANAFRSPMLTVCGFQVGVPTTGLAPGQYDLRASVRFADDENWYEFASAVVYVVAEPTVAPALSREEIENGRDQIRGAIDALDDWGSRRSACLQEPFLVITGTALTVGGWAFHPGEPIRAVRVRFGEHVVSGSIGYRRDDVATTVGQREAATSGFVVPIRLFATSPGVHRLSIECETASGWIGLAGSEQIVVIPEPHPFPFGARLLSEPLQATIDRPDGEVEFGTIVRLAGTIQSTDFADAYLEFSDVPRTVGIEPMVRYFPLSYPVLVEGEPQFLLELSGREFKRGRYEARVVASTPDRRAYRASAQRIRFDVIAASTRRGQRE